VDPIAGLCQFALPNARTRKFQTQLVAALDFLTRVIGISQKTSKNNNETRKTNKLTLMTPKGCPADREILRHAARVLRPDRRDWLTATIVAPGPFSEGLREGLLLAQT
jgi:hypothetical protein